MDSVGYDIVMHTFMDDQSHMASVAAVWAFSIPRLGQFRQMIADHMHG